MNSWEFQFNAAALGASIFPSKVQAIQSWMSPGLLSPVEQGCLLYVFPLSYQLPSTKYLGRLLQAIMKGIKGGQTHHHSSRLCHPSIFLLQMRPFLSLIRVLFFGLLASTVVANNVTCQKPKVRCEWRKLSPSERTEWIDAVNVFIPLPQTVYDVD